MIFNRISSLDNKQKFPERLNSFDWTKFFYIDYKNDLYEKYLWSDSHITVHEKKTIELNEPYINRHNNQLILEK